MDNRYVRTRAELESRKAELNLIIGRLVRSKREHTMSHPMLPKRQALELSAAEPQEDEMDEDGPQAATQQDHVTKPYTVSSQERLFKAKRRPLQPTQAFSVQRKEMERKLEQGYTFQELAAVYKMDEGVRRHMESLAAQIKETGSSIRLKERLSEAERRQIAGATHQALGRRGLNQDLAHSARSVSRGGVH